MIVEAEGGCAMAWAKNIRLDETLWRAATERADTEGTNPSALIRRWLTDYVDSGWPLPREGLPRLRLSADERARVTAVAVANLDVASVITTAVNAVCGNGHEH